MTRKINCTVRGEDFPWDAGESDMPHIPPDMPWGELKRCCHFPFYSNSHIGWASGTATDEDGVFASTYDGSNWVVGGMCYEDGVAFCPKFNVSRGSGNNSILGVFGINGNTCGIVYYDRCYIIRFNRETSDVTVLKEFVLPATAYSVYDTEYGYTVLTVGDDVHVFNKNTYEVKTPQVKGATALVYEETYLVAIGDGCVALAGKTEAGPSNIMVYDMEAENASEISGTGFYVGTDLVYDTPGWISSGKVLALLFGGEESFSVQKAYETTLLGEKTSSSVKTSPQCRPFYNASKGMYVWIGDGENKMVTSFFCEALETSLSVYRVAQIQDLLYFPTKTRCLIAFAGGEEDGIHSSYGNLLSFAELPKYATFSCNGDITVSQASCSIDSVGMPTLYDYNATCTVVDVSWTEATTSDPLSFS